HPAVPEPLTQAGDRGAPLEAEGRDEVDARASLIDVDGRRVAVSASCRKDTRREGYRRAAAAAGGRCRGRGRCGRGQIQVDSPFGDRARLYRARQPSTGKNIRARAPTRAALAHQSASLRPLARWTRRLSAASSTDAPPMSVARRRARVSPV